MSKKLHIVKYVYHYYGYDGGPAKFTDAYVLIDKVNKPKHVPQGEVFSTDEMMFCTPDPENQRQKNLHYYFPLAVTEHGENYRLPVMDKREVESVIDKTKVYNEIDSNHPMILKLKL